MKRKTHILILAAIPVLRPYAQGDSDKTANPSDDDSNARAVVMKADVKIVQSAREILSSPSKWNRADTRGCPPEARLSVCIAQ
jgi:hypothetical protein